MPDDGWPSAWNLCAAKTLSCSGLPRGGVPVAFEVAKALQRAAGRSCGAQAGGAVSARTGFGAIGEGGVRVINDSVVREAGLSAGRDGRGRRRAAGRAGSAASERFRGGRERDPVGGPDRGDRRRRRRHRGDGQGRAARSPAPAARAGSCWRCRSARPTSSRGLPGTPTRSCACRRRRSSMPSGRDIATSPRPPTTR